MPRSKIKKKTGARPAKNTAAGMPALDSITGIDEFRRGKKVFRIIHTNQVDEYEQAPSKAKPKRP